MDGRPATCRTLSGLAVSTSTWLASVFMLVLGAGLRLMMQALVLAAQNAVGYHVATLIGTVAFLLTWSLTEIPLRMTPAPTGGRLRHTAPAGSPRELERMVTAVSTRKERQ